MTTKSEVFRALHRSGDPLVLFNVWDAGSAAAVEKAGAHALGTSSWSIAATHGFGDGEKMPPDLAIAALARICAATSLPVTADLESGFGERPEDVAQTVQKAIEAGAIGCNLEDSYPATGDLRPIAESAARIAAARRAADETCPGFFINARCDVFFQGQESRAAATRVEETMARAAAYAAAGADGLFVPGLDDLALIEQLGRASPLPLNVMRLGTSPSIAELSAAGVARVSHGPYPHMRIMQELEKVAGEVR